MKHLLTFISLLLSGYCFSQSIGNGSAGSPTVSGIVNQYAAVTGYDNSLATHTEFTIDTTTVFTIGDLALVIQMQGATADISNTSAYGDITGYNSCGNYEYVKIKSVLGTVVQTTKVQKSYDGSGRIQLVKIPQYMNVTISDTLKGKPWNGFKGGVIAIDAKGTVTLNANIHASGIGFRGGVPKDDAGSAATVITYVEGSNLNGMKGEGIAGRGDSTNVKIYGRGKIANGGGGGNNHNAGGGGGANAGCGGLGGWGYYSSIQADSRGIGGASLLSAINENKIFMGGGGGAGQSNDGFKSVPGNGGGIVIITTTIVEGHFKDVNANGTDGTDINGYDGAAGGGAGGTVLFQVSQFRNISINCKGGKGGNPDNFMNQHLTAPGGGGGGGLFLRNNSSAGIAYNYSVDSGAAGVCDTSSFGATSGCRGVMLESLFISHPTSINPVTNGALVMDIYPNPAVDVVHISVPIKTDLAVYDIKGRNIYHAVLEPGIATIDVSRWQQGVYIFKLVNNEGISTGRMVK